MIKKMWQTLLARILLGQALACCIAMTGLFSSLLAQRKTSVALLQSTTAYALIFITLAPFQIYYSRKRENDRRAVLLPSSPTSNNNPSPTPTTTSATATTDNNIIIAEEEQRSSAMCFHNGYVVHRYFSSHFPVWRYFLLATCDVAASFFAIKAYSYTDITSAQLLDAATIFTVMVLGYFFLSRSFNIRHISGVVIAVGGMVGLVFIDAKRESRDSNKTAPNPVLGDALTLIASVLYGITNIGCECLLKSDRVKIPQWLRIVCPASCFGAENNNDAAAANETAFPESQHQQNRGQQAELVVAGANDDDANLSITEKLSQSFHIIVEYPVFISMFGCCFSVILLLATSLDDIADAKTHWSWHSTLYQLAFSCVMVFTYIGLPMLLTITNATFACLSLLTADAYAVVLNYLTSGTAPTGWYYLVAAVILGGVVLFDTAENKNCCCRDGDDDGGGSTTPRQHQQQYEPVPGTVEETMGSAQSSSSVSLRDCDASDSQRRTANTRRRSASDV